MSTQIVTRCQHCGASLSVDDGLFGRAVRCPACQESFVVSVVGFAATGREKVAQATAPDGNGQRGERLRRAPSLDRELGRIGRFELRERLGGGGFGVVYRAHDPILDRQVALKIPRIDHQDARATRRFLTEAKAAASLRHPGIVAVFESGQVDGHSYIASEFVEGRTVGEDLKRGRPSFETAAAWIRDVAAALAYAHAQGVIHRDIKPDNIILDAQDRPQLMDFGLAKRVDEDSSMTTDGSVLGTPYYMAPEQARGEMRRVGPASDQYSLGAVLYELLTGRRPFAGPPHAVVAQVASSEPPRPRSLNPAIPRDLEAICLRAMEPDPARRYPDVGEMAHDLGRWLAGTETRARPLRPTERLARWGRRRPAVALLTGMLILVATVGFSLVVMLWQRAEFNRRQAEIHLAEAHRQSTKVESTLFDLRSERDRAEFLATEAKRQRDRVVAQGRAIEERNRELQHAWEQARKNLDEAKRQQKLAEQHLAEATANRRIADQQRGTAERLQAVEQIDQAEALFDKGQTAAGMLWLAMALESLPPGAPELAHYARANLALQQRNLHELVRPIAHEGAVLTAAVHPGGELVLAGGEDRKARLWSAVTGGPVIVPLTYPGAVRAVAFSPDGRSFFVGSEDSTAELWDLSKEKSSPQHFEHPSAVNCAAFSGDGKLLVTGGADRRARIWNVLQGRLAVPPLDHEGPVLAVAVSPDGQRVLTGTGGPVKKAILWNAGTGQPIAVLQHGRHDVCAVGFSPDGRWLAAAGTDGQVQLWDTANRRRTAARFSHDGPIRALAFSPDGERLLTGCDDHTAKVWDLATGQPIGQALQHHGAVHAAAFAPTGTGLVTGSSDGVLRLWRNAASTPGEGPLPYDANVLDVAISPDGRYLATGSDDRTARLWDLATGGPVGEPMQHTGAVTLVAFSPDGATLLTGSSDTTARLWSTQTTTRAGQRMNHAKPLTAAAFSPDGHLIATASEDGTARLWNGADGTPVAKAMEHRQAITSVAFSPDGRTLVTGSGDRTARIWDTGTGELRVSLEHPDAITSVAVSPDGSLIVTGCADGLARLWDAARGTPVGVLAHQAGVRAATFSPDGSVVLTAGDDRTARLWDSRTTEPLLSPFIHQGPVSDAGFSPDGSLALTGSEDGTVRFWDVATGRPVGPPLEHGDAVRGFALSAGGSTLAVAARKRTARIWRIPVPLSTAADRVVTWAETVTGMRLDGGGEPQPLTPNEWQHGRQRLDAGEPDPDP